MPWFCALESISFSSRNTSTHTPVPPSFVLLVLTKDGIRRSDLSRCSARSPTLCAGLRRKDRLLFISYGTAKARVLIRVSPSSRRHIALFSHHAPLF